MSRAAARAKHVTAPADRVPFLTKVAFGVGTTAESLVALALGYTLFYYNQVIGMSPVLASLAMSGSLILDGLADPMIGSLSDRTRSKLGRRHPYMFIAPVFSCLSLAAIYNPPEALKALVTAQHGPGEMWLFAWFTAFVISLRVSMAFFHVPHLAMGGELSKDYVERSRVMSFSSFFGWMGGAPMRFIALGVFFAATPEYKNGLLNPHAYGPFAIICALMAFVCLMSSAVFTVDQIKRMPQPAPDVGKFTPFAFFGDIAKAFRNMNYTWLLIAYFFLSLMTGLRGALDLYVNTHFWHLDPAKLKWFIIGSFLGYIFALTVAPRLHGRFDKKPTIIFMSTMFAIIPAAPVVLHWAGIFPGPGVPIVPGYDPSLSTLPHWIAVELANLNDAALLGLIAFGVLGYGFTAILSISVMSALADIADENELRFGIRQEGVLYSTRTLFAKIDAAIGTVAAGFALQIINFPEKAKVGEVPREIVNHLALVESPIAAIPGLIAVLFYWQIKISNDSYAKTRADLDAARQARAEEAAAAATTGAEPQAGG